MKILILGGNGYIAQRCKEVWGDEGILVQDKVHSSEEVEKLIEEYKPDAVLNAAGVTGKPNVDWCETHQIETVVGNVEVPIMIAEACQKKDVYLLHIGSGCIFYGESPDPEGWREDDFGNPTALYSKCKYAADLSLSVLPNVGIARIRMPLDDRPTPRNIIDKLASYSKIIDVENSLTVIPDMIDVFYKLMEKKAMGIYHVTNPGTIKHRDIIELYKKHVDPTKENEWISEDDLVTEGLAAKKRSTNKLQSKRLQEIGIEMRPALEATEDAMQKYAEKVKSP